MFNYVFDKVVYSLPHPPPPPQLLPLLQLDPEEQLLAGDEGLLGVDGVLDSCHPPLAPAPPNDPPLSESNVTGMGAYLMSSALLGLNCKYSGTSSFD